MRLRLLPPPGRGGGGDIQVQFSFRPAGDGCHRAALRLAPWSSARGRVPGAAGITPRGERYQPCGRTAPLARTVDLKTFQNQTAKPKRLNEKLWHEMLRGKTLNQSRVLQHKQLRSPHLELALKQEVFDEGNCARRYWQLYFPAIGWSASRRDRKEDTAPNQMLNYGYAVLSALCHRGLLVHGLLPQLGVFHKPRFRSEPLVYDLMEAFRPAVELMLAEFMLEPDVSMKAWSKKVGTELRERRVQHQAYTLKLMDAIEASANSLARAYEENSVQPFWVPELPLLAAN